MAASYRKTRVWESLFHSEYCEIFRSTYFEEHLQLLLKICSWNWETFYSFIIISWNLFIRSFNFTSGFSISMSETSSWMVFHDWFPIHYFFRQKKIKSSRKDMLCEQTISQWEFDHGLFTKFTENYCRSRLFTEFIQTQIRYPTFLNKTGILTWKPLVISS